MSSQNTLEFRSAEDANLQYDVSTKPLGAGGFGTVYPGIRRVDGIKVAVKRVPIRRKPSILKTSGRRPLSFVPKELRLLRRAQGCPGVIRLYDSWRDETDIVLVMEHNENATDLSRHMDANGVLEEAEVAHIIRQLVRTLQSCQKKGIFHRDVKLDNVLYDKKTRETTLIDFGCGELTTSPKQTFTEYQGTMEYSPPEFYLEDTYTAEPATVWSIGCLAFIMIFGYKPFSNEQDIIKRGVDMQSGICSMRVRLFILKCLRHLPAERPSLESLMTNWFLKEVRAEPERKQEAPNGRGKWKACRAFPKQNRQECSRSQANAILEPIVEESPESDISEVYFLPRTQKGAEFQTEAFLKQVYGEVNGSYGFTRNAESLCQPKCMTISRRRRRPSRIPKRVTCVLNYFGTK